MGTLAPFNSPGTLPSSSMRPELEPSMQPDPGEDSHEDSDDSDDSIIFLGSNKVGDIGFFEDSTGDTPTRYKSFGASARGSSSHRPVSPDVPHYTLEPAGNGTVREAAAPPPTVLGKRQERSPEIAVSEALLEEIERVNRIFTIPCIKWADSPATFELAVAGHTAFRVRLSFPEGYPSDPPQVVPVPSGSGATMHKLTIMIVNTLRSDRPGKPCVERLMRTLVEALGGELGQVPWAHKPVTKHDIENDQQKVKIQGIAVSRRELCSKMESLMATDPEYPPKFPVFEVKDGWNNAFVS